MRLFGIFALLALTGCGRGVCGPQFASDTPVEHPCGEAVFYTGGAAYALRPLKGYSFQSRYYAEPTKAGAASTNDGCVYRLEPGWYGDADCAFPVSY